MTDELKTLKDLKHLTNVHFPGINEDICFYKDLKQEAIKWIKFLKEMPDELDFELYKERQRMNDGARLWIINFFNITEEDLK